MKYIADHDFHIHSTISPCCHDENQTPETILNYAKKNNTTPSRVKQNLEKDPNYYTTKGNTGHKLSDEQKQRMSVSHLGEKNSQYGKHRSEETKKRIQAALAKDYKAEYKEMYEVFLDHVLSSDEKRFFAKKYNIAYDSINRVLRQFI